MDDLGYSKDDVSLGRYLAYVTLRAYAEILSEKAVKIAFECLETARKKRLTGQIKKGNLAPLGREAKEEAADECLQAEVRSDEARGAMAEAREKLRKELAQKLRNGEPPREE